MELADDLLERLRANLGGFQRRTAELAGHKHAAVALTIVDEGPGADLPGIESPTGWGRRAALVLTRRSGDLRNHAGQWALPGGRLDPGETVIDTALREMSEEVGIHLGPEHVIGLLDDFVTRSGFVMTPVVVWGGAGITHVANPDEVASVHRIPVAEFLREDAPVLSEEIDGADAPVLRMPVGSDWIAAPTAAILYQFREVAVLGRDTRVAHYEQPSFAWR